MVDGHLEPIQQLLNVGITVEVDGRVWMAVTRQELLDAKRARGMARPDEHDISEPVRDQLHVGTVTCDVCWSVRTACAVWKRSLTAPSFGANRQHRSTASPPTSLSIQVFQHHSSKEGSAAEKFRDHGRLLVTTAAVQMKPGSWPVLRLLAKWCWRGTSQRTS